MFHALFQLVAIGNAGSGKTSLIKHFCESKFIPGYQPTVGVDYGFKIHKVADLEGIIIVYFVSITVRVHLWDLSGNTEYLDVRNELYGTTDAVFLMYDVTNQMSFDSLELWLRELSSYCNSHPDVFLVAHKVSIYKTIVLLCPTDGTDCPKHNRVISTGEGKKWASQHKLKYYETSAATGEGIEKMISDLLSEVILKRQPVTGKDSVLSSTVTSTTLRSKSAFQMR
ncbi:hypothetical protein LOTGIDRAFT_126741 [Lottia gigantea]|uniref:Roc domain-containing protein n=1 Tax=Lottia gigantea TaxID=225164 RepID=V4A412_LOTGI|nr:hypothetical protein LOTGIDRAFT_126741 [Lottia gigantea]ESO87976.1 hypothetical protein LOTGIDRAFT_126741 [Lottia gigantea]